MSWPPAPVRSTPIGLLLGVAEGAPADILDRLIAATAIGLLTLIVGSLRSWCDSAAGSPSSAHPAARIHRLAYNFDLKYSLIVASSFSRGPAAGPQRLHHRRRHDAVHQRHLHRIFFPDRFVAGLGRMSRAPSPSGGDLLPSRSSGARRLLLQIYLIYLRPGATAQPGARGVTSGIIALSLTTAPIWPRSTAPASNPSPRPERGRHRARPETAQIMWKIVLPQADARDHPADLQPSHRHAGKGLLAGLAAGGWELIFLARSYGRSDFRYMEMLLTAAALYWAMSIVFELLQVRIERYYGRGFAGERRAGGRRQGPGHRARPPLMSA